MQEKRSAIRIAPSAELPIGIQIMSANFFEVVRLQGRDISTGGISLYVDHRFQGCSINQEVDLIITPPNSMPFKAKVVIRHKYAHNPGSGDFGLYFTDISSQHRPEIHEFVQRALHGGAESAP